MSPFSWAIRSLVNSLGIAWWGRVETKEPNAIYWFGPFLTQKGLNGSLRLFIKDLELEQPASINHTSLRCRRSEPLTI